MSYRVQLYSSTPKAMFDAMRSVAYGDISGSYADLGGILTHPVIWLAVGNSMDADATVSFDDGATDALYIPAGGLVKLCLASMGQRIQAGAQAQVKTSGSPSEGQVSLMVLYAMGE